MAMQQNGMAGMAGMGRAPQVQPGEILLVIHDFDARSGDELTLRRSERVELIELDEGFGDGWFLGKHLTRGGTGLFPGVYTTKAPTTTRSPAHSRDISTVHSATTTSYTIPRLSVNNATPIEATPPPYEHPVHEEPSAETGRASLPALHHTTYVQRTIGETLGEHEKDSDSPVMNETLNVIDEHITDLSTPRQTMSNLRSIGDSESDYSSHLDRRSFLAGPETDEEDSGGLEEAIVRSWDHEQTAQHLCDIGVDPRHCDIFREQEISGDVLLDMDQNFIYMKEFDFGVMGRRLKTWHKIRDFQQEVKHRGSRRTSDRGQNGSLEDVGRVPSQNLGSDFLSRGTPPISEEPPEVIHPLQPTQSSKRTSWAAVMPSAPWKTNLPDSPVKATNAKSRHSRRHSSIDFGFQPDLDLASSSIDSPNKKSSTDRSWSMAGTGSTQATTPTSSIQPGTKAEDVPAIPPTIPKKSPSLDFERGYFSGNDIDNRKLRNRLSKSGRAAHSRQTSLADNHSKRSSMVKRHARLSSAGSVPEDSLRAPSIQPATKTGRFRSASTQATSDKASPIVTNLENEPTSNFGSPVLERMRMQDRAKKLIGFRTTSEAVTSEEKSNALKITPSRDTIKSSELVASPTTGDTTPSATPSLEMEALEGSDVATALTKNTSRPRQKSKQRTSAYTHGLLRIPPSEARRLCDYHGWMKKKSSGLMTTWKPRLFILRGRRLSYYYSENDTEEQGIIDISAHKVLVANDDPIVTIHASVTGASKATSTPKPDAGSASPIKASTPTSLFYFKLVPPKTGMSRAVQFTKPAIHYFQVDTIVEGRKWMGEIMKATIEHDLTSFETTNKQKTMSLAKARARRERPPALDDTKKVDEEENKVNAQRQSTRESGLGIEFQPSMVTPIEEHPPGSTSPKALSMLGLGPKTSVKSKKTERDEKILPRILSDEDKENAAARAPEVVIEDVAKTRPEDVVRA